MTDERDLRDTDVDEALRDFVREPVDLTGDGLKDALAAAARTPQVPEKRSWWPFGRDDDRSHASTTPDAEGGSIARGPRFGGFVAVVIVVAIIAFGAGIVAPFDDDTTVPAGSPTASARGSADPSPDPTMLASPEAPEARLELQPTIVVDATGSGDVKTIAEALDAVAPGDVIGVRPGSYGETLTIDADITLVGLGDDPTDVIITITEDTVAIPPEDPEDGPSFVAMTIIDASPTVSNLSFDSQVLDGIGVDVQGGAPMLSRLAYTSSGENFGTLFQFGSGAGGEVRDSVSSGDISLYGGASTLVTGVTLVSTPGFGRPTTWIDGLGTTARLEGNTLGSVAIEGGSPTIIDNEILGAGGGDLDCGIWTISGDEPTDVTGISFVARGNRIHDWSTGICIDDGTIATIQTNEFVNNDRGIEMSPAASATISGNRLEGNRIAISVDGGAQAAILGNTFVGGVTGIEAGTVALDEGGQLLVHGGIVDNTFEDVQRGIDLNGSAQTVSGNTISGGRTGIEVRGQGTPTLLRNTVTGARAAGIRVREGVTAHILENELCASAVNVELRDGHTATYRDNIVCAEDVASGNAPQNLILGGVVSQACIDTVVCPLGGRGEAIHLGLERTAPLSVASGSSYAGPGMPFEIKLVNGTSRVTITGSGDEGTFHVDEGFAVDATGWVIGEGTGNTWSGERCSITISRATIGTLSGNFACADPDTGARDEVLGDFDIRVVDRGAASAYTTASGFGGSSGEMRSFDADVLFDGDLVDISSGTVGEPFSLRFEAGNGASMEVTGTMLTGTWTGDGDGLTLTGDQGGVGRTWDSRTRECEIRLTKADLDGIVGDWSCPANGDGIGGSFNAIP